MNYENNNGVIRLAWCLTMGTTLFVAIAGYTLYSAALVH